MGLHIFETFGVRKFWQFLGGSFTLAVIWGMQKMERLAVKTFVTRTSAYVDKLTARIMNFAHSYLESNRN